MEHNNYSINQYNQVRALALDLIERNRMTQLDIDDFLDALRDWILAPAATREKVRKSGKLSAPHERLLQDYQTKMINILNGNMTSTLGFITNLCEELKVMTKVLDRR